MLQSETKQKHVTAISYNFTEEWRGYAARKLENISKISYKYPVRSLRQLDLRFS